MRTLIETSTKKRFETKFMVLENHKPTKERVLVFKESESSPNFLVLKYSLDDEGRPSPNVTFEEMPEEEFKTQNGFHKNPDETSLREHDLKREEWRSSSIKEKLKHTWGKGV